MTKLRDDGYLETDDPVVAACFIGHRVLVGSSSKARQLTGITKWSWMLRETQRKIIEVDCDIPILIPAAILAEVYAMPDDGPDIHPLVIARTLGFIDGGWDWLRKHTVEAP